MSRNRFERRRPPRRNREGKPGRLGIPSLTFDILGHRIRTKHNHQGEMEVHLFSEDTDISLTVAKAGGIMRLYHAVRKALQGEVNNSKKRRKK